MSERGQYRSITVVLLDGPDFQLLTPEARWVFTVLKISMGPSGIEVWYPEALVAVLVARTGYPDPVVRAQMDTLQASGWIRTDRNVVWIVKQLQYEPAMTPKNEKHRTSVRAHVLGLPRIAIVGDFIRQYQAYLEDWQELAKVYPKPDECQPIAYGKGSDSLSNHRDRDRGPSTETQEVTTTSADAAKSVDRRETAHSHGSCMRLVVDRLYFGKRPSERDMATNGSILRNFATAHGYDRMATIIEGLALRRNRGELHGVGANQAVSLKWLNSNKMLLNQLAVSEDAIYRGDPPARKGKGGLADLSSGVDAVIANIGRGA